MKLASSHGMSGRTRALNAACESHSPDLQVGEPHQPGKARSRPGRSTSSPRESSMYRQAGEARQEHTSHALPGVCPWRQELASCNAQFRAQFRPEFRSEETPFLRRLSQLREARREIRESRPVFAPEEC